MKLSASTIISIIYILFLFGLIGTACVALTHNLRQPIHKVRINYTVYRGDKPFNKTGVYEVRGKSFKPVREAQYHRYSSSPNVLLIEDEDAWLCYVNKQSVCVYIGYNDVECNSLEIIE